MWGHRPTGLQRPDVARQDTALPPETPGRKKLQLRPYLEFESFRLRYQLIGERYRPRRTKARHLGLEHPVISCCPASVKFTLRRFSSDDLLLLKVPEARWVPFWLSNRPGQAGNQDSTLPQGPKR